MYRHIDASLIRASVLPLATPVPAWPGEDAGIEQIRAWVEQAWEDGSRAEAIAHASPSLASAIEEVIQGTVEPLRVRRVSRSLARYLLRMRHRATPFGLFAGPAVAHTGQQAHVRWEPRNRAFGFADASWLHEVTAALERTPAVLRYLKVVVDPTHVVRGSRIVVMNQPGKEGPTDTSLRRTRVAEHALKLAHAPIPTHVLVDELGTSFPGAPEGAIEELVRGLVTHRVLLTELRAPMTHPDGLGHVVARLDETGADTATAAQLRSVHRLLDLHNHAHPADQPGLRAKATDAMASLTGAARTLVINVRPGCDITLPHAVAHEAEHALRLMARITPYPRGSAAWQDYRNRFLERYSMGTVIPVRELTDADTGLGFPVGYRSTVLPRPTLATTPRDEHLLRLAQDAALNNQREIVLTEEDVEALSLGEPTAVPAHVELCFSVLARSTRALTEGRFTLSTVGLSLAAGTLTGRFLPILDPPDQTRMAVEYATLPTLTEGAARPQISAPPLRRHIDNVGRAPVVAPEVLAVGEHNPDATVALDDLGVVADAGRLYLVSISSGQCLEPSAMSAVELSTATHPLSRFLAEVHRSHAAVLVPFAWGAASRLPFLPEVRYGRTTLSPACWRLRSNDFFDRRRWTKDFTAWRSTYGVPQAVYVGSSDQQLRLDLDRPGHLDLLRAELDRHGVLALHEAPEESAYGWIGRAHEVTMSFAADQHPVPAPACRTVVQRSTARLPGATARAYLKVYGSQARATEVLTDHLPRLLEGLPAPSQLWFTRYADPDPHLRVRLLLPAPGEFGAAAGAVARWAAELREEGLIHRIQWDTDQPETGRYGEGTVLAAAERFFATDSTAALAQMRVALPSDLRPAITAASYLDIATGLLGSATEGRNWLIHNLLRADGAAAPRPTQDLARRLTDRHEAGHALNEFPEGNAVQDSWKNRQEALADYRRALDTARLDPADVLPSLLHMHHNRVAGIDPDAEARCRRTARAAALSRSVRHQGDTR
ncbi:lantibiotic dehydratase [Streptomyces spiramenti]|uniref:Lantibiotic dehydratase n=1 Tax=Streptomyces spiramenti TaxID=2720606 RepID=A0ABX1AL38_9ACTN|nr:lantibiotic dehydratase [Streptomyces spiramenti]NJP65343.1 lantibiotic dehydratase [Streptomyces spiramenti]